ncbi:conjugal transfer protein [Streptomyces sp. NPDC005525]|uniref:conjugal transfer protein n=1 Tax=Streptomyces sp. NPDC005525 TaxID=3364720 RepID=UPI003688BC8D
MALIAVCVMPRTVVAAAQPRPVVTSSERDIDPAGVAALFCDLWLRSDDGATESRTAQSLRALAPDVELPTRSEKAVAQPVGNATALRSARLGDGSWSVVVAVQFSAREDESASSTESGASTLVRYFAVPVVAADGAGGAGEFTVTAPPSQIAGPGTAVVASSRFENQLPADGALASSLGEFFDAYLAGVGEVERYLSPHTELAAVKESGYTSVAVDEAMADSDVADGRVPADGTVVRVRAHVTASAARAEQWPLVYTLTMTARSGRWEVTALEAGADHSGSGAKTSSEASGKTVGGTAK